MNAQRACEGGCHCGAVRFRIAVPGEVDVLRCNCSICRMTGYQHLTIRHEDFTLLRGGDTLTEYRFNTGTARHLFCAHCGIKSFYQPRSHPDAWSVNLNCVELPAGVHVRMVEFDGGNWERHVDEIRELVN
ncbi:GFA family protein [Marinihelvus fidelis]|uniref:GFA family protein n=1 Tax=Marinihelvus fidelis TaxID=2613842 RepID=A0A5N0TCT5_9GAMM|nr:GFA family protein [Marinihelvus fidelis]KAA9131877.1 GFA family protein [Marinihelvus fidelis]